MVAYMFGRSRVVRSVFLAVEEPRKVSAIAARVEVCALFSWLVLLVLSA